MHAYKFVVVCKCIYCCQVSPPQSSPPQCMTLADFKPFLRLLRSPSRPFIFRTFRSDCSRMASAVTVLKTSAATDSKSNTPPTTTSAAVAPKLAPIRGVVFDMDGTLTLPNSINFVRLRQRLGVSKGEELLSVLTNGSEESRVKAGLIIEEEEKIGAETSIIQSGYSEVMHFIDHDCGGMPRAILTRNSAASVQSFFDSHATQLSTITPAATQSSASKTGGFNPVLTRDATCGYKPSPQPLKHLASLWNVQPSELLMIGDAADDLKCAHSAGTHSALLVHAGNEHLIASYKPTFVLKQLTDLIPILQHHSPLWRSATNNSNIDSHN